MKDNDTLRNVLISGAVFVLVLWGMGKLVPPVSKRPAMPTDQREPVAAKQAAASPDHTDTPASPPSDGAVAPVEETPGGLTVIEAEKAQTATMGSEPTNGVDKTAPSSPYRMRLTLSNVGAGVASATITDHAATLGSDERYELLSEVEAEDGTILRSLGVEQINIDGVDVMLLDKKWNVEPVRPFSSGKQRGETIEFWIEIQRDGAPALKLTRTFTLPQQDLDSGRHDLQSDITVENLSNQPLSVIVTYRGGLGVRKRVSARMDDRVVDFGVSREGRVEVARKRIRSQLTRKPDQPLPLFEPSAQEPDSRLCWAATANTYFTCTIAPLNRDGTDNANYLAEVSALDADSSPITDGDVTLRFVTRASTVAPGQTLSHPVSIYIGEKDGDSFRTIEEYQRRNYYVQISLGFGMCTFTWLVELMIWLLNALFVVTRDFGLAIIILVLVVRALLHPITKKGQVNMIRMQHRMGEFSPKIEELKKKFGNDKARLQQETMKLYREHGVNPATQMLTCLPMFIQMPIWFALYLSLSNNIGMRHEPAFWGLSWISDMTAPDALYTFASPIHVPIVGWELPALNLLPLLVSVFMFTQQKLQPKPKPNPNASDQQRQQQEMMQKMAPMMSIMMLFFFYKMPSGLNLYIMSSSLFGTIEQYLIRKHIKEREATGTLHKPSRKDNTPGPSAGKRGKPSFFQRMQAMAEEAQKTQVKKPPKRKARR